MTRYVLFGSEAVGLHSTNELIEVINSKKFNTDNFELYEFLNPCDPAQVLEAFRGWNDYCDLTQIEFYAYCYLKSL